MPLLKFSEATWTRIAATLGLSRREVEVIHCILAEQKEGSIGAALGISPHTVHTHVERLYKKLGVTSRCGVLARVFAEYLKERGLGRPNGPDGELPADQPIADAAQIGSGRAATDGSSAAAPRTEQGPGGRMPPSEFLP